MKNMNNLLKKYAELAVKIGVNIQPNQTLVLNTPIECAEFARLISESAYEAGAKEVHINWGDEKSARIKYLMAHDEVFDEIPQWLVDSKMHYMEKGAAFLSIAASNPENLKGCNPERIARFSKASSTALKEFSKRLMSNQNAWSIVSIPTVDWAKKVFPNDSEEVAVEKLWDAIFKIVRIDQEDPVAAWETHKNNLKEKMNYLNSKNLVKLHFKNSIGTDLEMELPDGHIWVGGAEHTQNGVEFIANMPTEEIFSMPKKTGVNGTVVSSKPLNYGGNLINNFKLTFKDGKVVDFSAEEGYDSLKHLIETDEGSHYLGEVALVPFDSPISNSGITFFNTLYDENASCHFAIGKAYTLCIENGDKMSDEDLEAAGANTSLTHVDFMLGTSDLEIIGFNAKGEEIKIFTNGNWAF